jgi:hypothetical protein
MISLQNKKIQLTFLDNGKRIQISDILRHEIWTLDQQSLVCELAEGHSLLTPVSLKQDGNRIQIVYNCLGKAFTLQYELMRDYIEVTLIKDKSDAFISIALPGSFEPEEASSKKYLLPVKQGMLWDLRGKLFENRYRYGAHSGVSMAMLGCLGKSGAMLVTAETADDCVWLVGKDESGRSYATCLQESALGETAYDRRVRLYMTAPTITAVAKRYRQRVIEKGRFKSWKEKIAERPAVQKIFGAAMCFIGYMQDDLDYAAECRKLKAMGFDKALVYPVRFNTVSPTVVLHGVPNIHLNRDEVQKIKELGYEVAPWSWITELLDGSEEPVIRYRLNAQGERSLFWQMDGLRYFKTCSATFAEYQRKANAEKYDDLTWDHFDVMATSHNNECYALDHEAHAGRPLGRVEDREHIRQLFRAAQEGNRIISSEGFIDAYSMEYDLGASKAWPRFGPWEFWPVPLTMLVYHDSMTHTWWEMHSYNDHRFGGECGTHQYGSGQPRIMAAMDALYGCAPHVFPFGCQYAWKTSYKETYIYRIRLEEPETQYALSLAKPVADLHESIGMLEMTGFEILSEDGNLQKTTFEDGTTVYANFSNANSMTIEGLGQLQGESWKVVRN